MYSKSLYNVNVWKIETSEMFWELNSPKTNDRNRFSKPNLTLYTNLHENGKSHLKYLISYNISQPLEMCLHLFALGMQMRENENWSTSRFG